MYRSLFFLNILLSTALWQFVNTFLMSKTQRSPWCWRPIVKMHYTVFKWQCWAISQWHKGIKNSISVVRCTLVLIYTVKDNTAVLGCSKTYSDVQVMPTSILHLEKGQQSQLVHMTLGVWMIYTQTYEPVDLSQIDGRMSRAARCDFETLMLISILHSREPNTTSTFESTFIYINRNIMLWRVELWGGMEHRGVVNCLEREGLHGWWEALFWLNY